MITHFFYIVSVYKDTKLRTRLDLLWLSILFHFSHRESVQLLESANQRVPRKISRCARSRLAYPKQAVLDRVLVNIARAKCCRHTSAPLHRSKCSNRMPT